MTISLQDNLKQLRQYEASIKQAKRSVVAVGLPAEKVGDAIYGDGNSVIKIGSIHEFGASFTHPGGTPYVIGDDGKATFVKKGTDGVSGVTEAHNITIPQRSFLRVPFQIKADELNDFTAKQFAKVFEGEDVEKVLGLIGVKATNISREAFTTQGFGTWPANKSDTVREKGSSQPLVDTGTLRNSITWSVRLS